MLISFNHDSIIVKKQKVTAFSFLWCMSEWLLIARINELSNLATEEHCSEARTSEFWFVGLLIDSCVNFASALGILAAWPFVLVGRPATWWSLVVVCRYLRQCDRIRLFKNQSSFCRRQIGQTRRRKLVSREKKIGWKNWIQSQNLGRNDTRPTTVWERSGMVDELERKKTDDGWFAQLCQTQL